MAQETIEEIGQTLQLEDDLDQEALAEMLRYLNDRLRKIENNFTDHETRIVALEP